MSDKPDREEFVMLNAFGITGPSRLHADYVPPIVYYRQRGGAQPSISINVTVPEFFATRDMHHSDEEWAKHIADSFMAVLNYLRDEEGFV